MCYDQTAYVLYFNKRHEQSKYVLTVNVLDVDYYYILDFKIQCVHA